MAQICVTTLVIVAVLIISQGVYAKRGCSSFGHSCFGGHGKRSSGTAMNEVQEHDLMNTRRQMGQEEIPPHPGYPRSSLNGILASGDDIIPIRDGGVYDHDEAAIKELMRFRLRNIVKHWMDNYRRSQQNTDTDGYVMDPL